METIFYTVIRHLHSVVRWLLLSGLLGSVILAISGLADKKGLGRTGRLFARLTVYFAHLQLLVGVVLFLISPRVIFSSDSMQSPILRFFRMKKASDEVLSARTLLWFYIFSLVIILILIPWPFTRYAGHFM
jgi:voltage-gated potassium channel Kch